jgi:putative ABC transport system permease protein
MADSVAQRRFQVVMLTIFAAVAILLAAIGIYGGVTYSVVQRRVEIEVRLALGTNSSTIKPLMLRDGMKPVLVGIGIGVLAGGLGAQLIKSLLFEVRPLDPVVLLWPPLLLGLVALVSCYLPTRVLPRSIQ